MSHLQAAHRQFLVLVAEFYRELGSELPYFESEAENPVAFAADADGVGLTVGYDPRSIDMNLFVHCVFGELPAHDEEGALRRLLERNLPLLRARGMTYCLDSQTQKVGCYLRTAVAGVDVHALREILETMAREAARWRAGHFLSNAESEGEQSIFDGAAFA